MLYFHDLSEDEKKEFDWDGAEESAFFRYKDRTYSLDEFTRCPQDLAETWDGVSSDSFFSGVLVKIVNEDQVIVGTYYS